MSRTPPEERPTTKVRVPGDRLGEFYEIERLLQGGMGLVYFVRDRRFDRGLVLKGVRPDVRLDEECVVRFLREAELWLNLPPHDHVVELITLDRIDRGLHILSERVDGGTLDDWISGLRPVGERLRLAREIADGMAHVHAAGLLHRDLKPPNIFLTADGHARVGDFGLAKPLAGPERVKAAGGLRFTERGEITVRGTVVGTPSYMAPEMWYEGSVLGPAADIYAFGVILYEMFLGRRPFEVDPGLEPLARYEELRTLHASAKAEIPEDGPVPPAVRELILLCLAKQPAFRPSGFPEVAARLDAILGGRPAPAPRPERPPAERRFYRGLAWSTLGDLPKAIEEYSAALQADPSLAEALVNRGRDYRDTGRLQEAYDDLSAAVRKRPDFALAFTHRGAILHAAGDLAGAERDYAEALRLRPDDPETLLNRSALRLARGDSRAAAEDLDRLIAARPDYAPAWNNRGLQRRKSGELAAAVADFDRALDLDPTYATAAYNRACARAEGEDLEGAVADFTLAIGLAPRDLQAWYNRGATQLDLEHWDHAKADFESALRLDPAHAPSHLGLGMSLLNLGLKGSAAASLERFLDLAPRHPMAAQAREWLAGL